MQSVPVDIAAAIESFALAQSTKGRESPRANRERYAALEAGIEATRHALDTAILKHLRTAPSCDYT